MATIDICLTSFKSAVVDILLEIFKRGYRAGYADRADYVELEESLPPLMETERQRIERLLNAKGVDELGR